MLILSGKYHGCRPSTVSQPFLSRIFSGWAYTGLVFQYYWQINAGFIQNLFKIKTQYYNRLNLRDNSCIFQIVASAPQCLYSNIIPCESCHTLTIISLALQERSAREDPEHYFNQIWKVSNGTMPLLWEIYLKFIRGPFEIKVV